ncbi:GIY-YIG nuclease superfamily protein [Lacunisphaera limnophila]|uniref:GIY-YIG nuclease superfamily protein n=1 Tax=Lacunisphaera limnophila TaxID=1838286 RepID=A0A1D8AV19_9BACT|nr:GIY-YIG nuclease family protein [Lacunisphaera limnophila]AOS44732.1 GIY-YIG nuclease superfamily protein [Lacunisphaera limnophila]
MPELFPVIPIPAAIADLAWVYILQTADGALYIGQTRDIGERLRKHRHGLGSKFTTDHSGPRLVFCEGTMSLDEAVVREHQLKRWSRPKKEALIRGDLPRLRELSRSRERPGNGARA